MLNLLVFILILFIFDNEWVVSGIQANRKSWIFIDFLFGIFLLDLPQLVLSHQELLSNQKLDSLLSFLHRHVLIENWYSVSFNIIYVKVFFTIIGVDRIELEKVLFSVWWKTLNVTQNKTHFPCYVSRWFDLIKW